MIINPICQEELLSFLDDKSKDIIKYFITKSLFSQPEPKPGQKLLPIQIPKEHIEQWFTQALDVKPVGAGSYPIDIYNEREHWGADVKMLNIKVNPLGEVENGDSGEASLGQKFTDVGINLDALFESKSYEEIKDKWVSLYDRKYESLKDNYPFIKKIYYFFILRPGIQKIGTNFYIAGAVLDLEQLESITVNQDRTTASSVYVDNFISNEYGNVKIYKAKKRLELRLKPKTWVDNGKTIRIKTSFSPMDIDLRKQDINPEFLKKRMENIQNLKIDFML